MGGNLTQIVDDIKTSPTVLLDLNSDAPYSVRDFEAPPPPLRYTTASSMLADGDRIGSTAYGNRTIDITLDLIQSSQDLWASSWQTLARLLDQDWYWLKYQPVGATSPVFFRCYRTQVPSIEDMVAATAYKVPTLQIPAEPFAYGLIEDLGTFTITNDASTGTNKQYIGPVNLAALASIKGDVETPLLLAQTSGPGITMIPSTSGYGAGFGYVATYSLSGGNTQVLIARNLTELASGTDTGATVTGAGSAYQDGDYKATTIVTTTMQTRLSGAFTTTLTPLPGLYRILVRCGTTTGGSIGMRLGVLANGSSAYIFTPTVTASLASNAFHMFDLGLMQFPAGTDTRAVGLQPAATTTRAVNVALQASGSASAVLRWDELYLLPVDVNYGRSQLAIVDFPDWNASVQYNVVMYDGHNDAIRSLYDSTGTAPFAGIPAPASSIKQSLVTAGSSFVGGLPMLRPSTNNYLQFIYLDSVVGGTTNFAAKYYPRYLYVRPASS